jgi:aryl-alcohol dehydrogenase-like predicted oxidoreductase
LGEALHQLGVTAHVATKVALSLQDLDQIGDSIRRSVEASLVRLRVADLALIQLHNRIGLERAAKAPFGTGAMLTLEDVSGAGGVVEAFEQLRARGLVRHFGCSAFGGDMGAVARLIDGGGVDVLTVHYSILNRSAWGARADGAERDYGGVGRRAAARRMGTVALRVLEGGALTATAGRADESPARLHAQRLAALVAAERLSAAEAAVRFALSNDEIDAVLIGFSSLEQIRAAAEYSSRGPLRPELLALIEGT